MADPYEDLIVFTDLQGNILTEADVGWDNGVAVTLRIDAPEYELITGKLYRNQTQIGEFRHELGLPLSVIWYIGEGVLNPVNNGDVLRAVVETPFTHEVSLPVKRKQVPLALVGGSASIVKQLQDVVQGTATQEILPHVLTEVSKVQSIGFTRRQALNIRNLERYMEGTYPMPSVPVYAYHDPTQLQQALSTLQPPSLLEIFNSWTRTNRHEYFPGGEGATGDAAAWLWDANSETVVQPINTSYFTAFISPVAVESYDAEVTVTSSNSDDDWICFVLAFHRDTTANTNHSLCVVISKGADNNAGTNPYPNYYIAKQMESNTRQNILVSNAFSDDSVGGWSNNRFRIWAKRRGNQFTIYGSGWSDITRKPESLMTFSLDDDPDLAIYKGPKPYGYGATSQANSSFHDLVFTGGVNHSVILDTLNNQVYRYANGVWAVVTGVTIHDIFGAPRTLLSVDTDNRYRLNLDGSITQL